MNLQERIKLLTDNGFVFNETTRYFISPKGKIDQDIVQYGRDKLFDKYFNKLKP